MKFRPCIDLHEGQVKQIVGSSLNDNPDAPPLTNFVAKQPATYYAKKYKQDRLTGGHIIMLGKNNEKAAKEALQVYPKGLQIGGGITDKNAKQWLIAGADKLIVTSYIFQNGEISWQKLQTISALIGKENLVLDLSCRFRNGKYYVVTDRWQHFTSLLISSETMQKLAGYCSEFLIHAVDVEGKQQGMDAKLITLISQCSPITTTYAGGIKNLQDIKQLAKLANNKLDYTVGSALDIFGGKSILYQELVKLNNGESIKM